MSKLVRLMQPQAAWSPPGAWDDDWGDWHSLPGGSWLSQAGVKVTPQTALMVSTIWACIRVITETMASIPLPVYERQANDTKQRATELPLYTLLHDSPNQHQTSFSWREMITGHAALRGNGLTEIETDGRGEVAELIPLHPDLVRLDVTDQGTIRYLVKQPDGSERTLLEDEVFHLHGPSDNGITGMNVVEYARDSIGLAQAAEAHGSRSFSHGTKLAGVLEHPARLTEAAAKNIRTSWEETYGGVNNANKTAVLWEGMKWQAVGMTNEAAQWLASRQFTVADLARRWRMPLHMIGEHEKNTSWGTGIEQMTIGFVVYTMLPWARRWEQQITKQLIVNPAKHYAEFLFDGLLRGDAKARSESYAIAVQWGWMTRNEVRRLENMNPIEGMDEMLTPLNMAIGNPPRPLAPAEEAIRALTSGEPMAMVRPETPEGNDLLKQLSREQASRLIRQEVTAVRKNAVRYADDQDGWDRWVGDFYDKHAERVAQTLHIPPTAARWYAQDQKASLERDGVAIAETWDDPWRAEQLAGLMTGEDTPRLRKVRKTGTVAGHEVNLVEEEIA